jgi:hypothetical protein
MDSAHKTSIPAKGQPLIREAIGRGDTRTYTLLYTGTADDMTDEIANTIWDPRCDMDEEKKVSGRIVPEIRGSHLFCELSQLPKQLLNSRRFRFVYINVNGVRVPKSVARRTSLKNHHTGYPTPLVLYVIVKALDECFVVGDFV